MFDLDLAMDASKNPDNYENGDLYRATVLLGGEVESLRAEYAALDERAAIAVEVTGRRWSAVADELRAEVVSLRAAVERVREFCRGVDENPGDGKVWAAAVLELLDGET